MCGIFCSFSKDKILELSIINSYRGVNSFSVTHVRSNIEPVIIRRIGTFDPSIIECSGYKICHVQTPTSEAASETSIHPASFENTHLWHNGLIKAHDIKRLQEKQKTSEKWDTRLLLNEILELESCDINLSNINGSFACVMLERNVMYVFRNEISPLFYDNELNFSSVKFEGSDSLQPNVIFRIDVDNKKIIPFKQFTTKENPYFFNTW